MIGGELARNLVVCDPVLHDAGYSGTAWHENVITMPIDSYSIQLVYPVIYINTR